MSLKYLDEILELLASEKFRTLVKDVEFNLQGTLKVDVIATIFCMTILFYLWKKLFGVFHREQLNPEFNPPYEQNNFRPEEEEPPGEEEPPREEKPPSSDNESTRTTEAESSDNESGNLQEDSDAIPNDQESRSGLLLDHPHQHSDMSFPESESSDNQSLNYHGDSEGTQDEPDSWSGPIVKCNCDSH